METNFTSGQILFIQSVENFFYISIMRNIQHHPVVNDVNRYEIDTCCDLCIDVYSGEMYPAAITFARACDGSIFDMDIEFDEVRLAHDFEKKLLFDRLVYEYKSYDTKWTRLTDSTFYDIRDWLCWEFDVDINLLPNDSDLPGTIYEITHYIWDALCKETGNYQDKTKSEMVNKQEFIAKVRKWLELETNWNTEYDEQGRNDNYGKIDELVKYLEE